ncbi:MAG: hypothetical protein ABIR79_07105 [Candidatus Binatia bacterium]
MLRLGEIASTNDAAHPIVTASSTPISGTAVTRSWRVVTAVLSTVSHGSLLFLALASWLVPDQLPSGTLLRAFGLLCLAPALVAWLLRRVHATTMTVSDDVLVLRARAEGIEIPLASIAAVVPWWVPLPAPGFWLGLRSGQRLPEGLIPNDPGAFLSSLADAGISDEVLGPPSRHPMSLYAKAKSAARRRIDHPLLKFVLFSLVPTLPLFRLRQFLVYGGTFGEYYQYGLKVYLLGFGIYWLLFAVYLLLYAAVLRALTEAASLAAAWSMPAHAASVRRGAETVHRILYYAGVPAVLALRLFPW